MAGVDAEPNWDDLQGIVDVDPKMKRAWPKTVAAWWVGEDGEGSEAVCLHDMLQHGVEAFMLLPPSGSRIPENGVVDWSVVTRPSFPAMDEYRQLADIASTRIEMYTPTTVPAATTPAAAGCEGIYVLDGAVYCDVDVGEGWYLRLELKNGHLLSLAPGARRRLRPHTSVGNPRIMFLTGTPATTA